MIPVPLFDLKFLVEFAASAAGTSNRRHWSDEEMIGAKGRMTVKNVEQAGNEVTVTADWKSSFYGGPSRYVFIVDGDRIREMRITAA
jgi:hypothetical protein